jgi:nucleotide-binding universal stress UspA family protein
MDTSIICGVDGSPESRNALRVASELADALRLQLVVAHVSQAAIFAPAYGSAPVLTAPTVSELRAAEELLEDLALDEELANATLRAVHGLPAERLAELADDEDAAFIVVGSRGRGALKAAFLGSVSRDLIGIAPCPVLVVPSRVHVRS